MQQREPWEAPHPADTDTDTEPMSFDRLLAAARNGTDAPSKSEGSDLPTDVVDPLAGVDGLHYTDAGNAERLVRTYGELLRYVPKWGRWLVFDGTRWRPDDDATFARNCARTIAGQLLKRAPEVIRDTQASKELRAAVKRLESAAGVDATLRMASSIPGVAIDHEALDADPWLLNVKNGTVDLRTGELRPHRADDLHTMVAAVDYDADATAPRWDAFLARVLPDESVRALAQRLAGLGLVGETIEHVMPICLGGGANGKSTLTNIVAEILGDYAVVAARDVLLVTRDAHPTAVADLFRRRFVHSGEIPESARLDEAQVKQLTGGDRITARRMREDFWTFAPSHLLWLHANHKPVVRGTDDGIWRRLLLMPFNVQVPPDERDPHLARTIVKNEGAGVLNWALQGLADHQANGLKVPDAVSAATDSYRNESDTVAAFIAECIRFDPHAEIPGADLLAAHGNWFAEAGATEKEGGHFQRVTKQLEAKGARRRRVQGRSRWAGILTA